VCVYVAAVVASSSFVVDERFQYIYIYIVAEWL
jgi:hypothetical protein